MWDAEFKSPAELLSRDGSARSQLELLKGRVTDRMLGKNLIDDLLVKMESVLSVADLERLSAEVSIDRRLWQITTATLAEQNSQFLAAVIHDGKQDSLLERLSVMHPGVLR